MKIKSQALLAMAISSSLLSACSQQQAAPVIPDAVVAPPIINTVPAPKPYKDIVVKPAPLQPAPMPAPIIRPAPVAKPAPVVIVPKPKPIRVPPVKAKGNYLGSVPIDERLRQQYQQ